MRVEIVAVGTELLLGQIADTNSQWLGEQLAANGLASHFHQHVGDNHERMVLAFRTALARSDALIVCGGLGPTQDDITRAAIAEIIKGYARLAGMNAGELAGHSLRAGFATQAILNNVPDHIVMGQTRHQSATVFRRYVRPAKLFRDNPSGKVGL